MVTSVLPGPGVSTALPRPLSSCAPLGRIEHMFDSGAAQDVGDSPMSTATLRSWVGALSQLDRSVDDTERVSQMRVLEQARV